MDFNASGSGITFKAIRNMFRDTLAIFYRARILHYYTRQVNKQHVSA